MESRKLNVDAESNCGGDDDKSTGYDCKCDKKSELYVEETIIDEELVHVEINGIIQDLFKCKGNSGGSASDSSGLVCKFIGLESEQPLVQIGNQVFAGTLEDTFGTSVFFTVDDNCVKEDEVFDNYPAERVDYVCKSDKKLMLKRVFLTSKAEESKRQD